MATRTSSKKSETITVLTKDGSPSDYEVVVVPGESITVRAHKVVRRELTDNYQVNYYGPSLRDEMDRGRFKDSVMGWIATLPQPVKNQMGAVSALAYEQDWGKVEGDCMVTRSIFADLVEENGGQRVWAKYMNAHRVEAPVYEDFERTFRIGDQAEESSFNLSYMGEIVGITTKSVIIERKYEHGKTRRLSLLQFCDRNWMGTEDKIRTNREWRD